MNPTWQQIVELAEKATPRPWYAKLCSVVGCWCKWIGTHPTSDDEPADRGICHTGALAAIDADYIVAAANADPDMAARLLRIAEILVPAIERELADPSTDKYDLADVGMKASEARELLKLLEPDGT